jgi:hypothetical protein
LDVIEVFFILEYLSTGCFGSETTFSGSCGTGANENNALSLDSLVRAVDGWLRFLQWLLKVDACHMFG